MRVLLLALLDELKIARAERVSLAARAGCPGDWMDGGIG
jgi:hypothetical protein